MIAALFGLLSALSWGTGDFAGGLASRKVGAHKAVILGYAIGLGFLLIAWPFIHEPFPEMPTALWSSIAGIAGATGLLFFFEAMRLGRISIAAPLAALIGAIIPVVVGGFIEGAPEPLVLFAFVLALIAVALISIEKDEGEGKRKAHLFLPILAGITFGLYFVFMNKASENLVIGPLVIARFSGMLCVAIYLLFKRASFRIESGSWHLLTINGFFDVGGNLFYILAAQAGRLDISAVLSSLYPGMTVFLAWLILKEKLQFLQWIGIILALIAIILITVA